eukprot:CAMPEP_0198122818 /NCGR_PEP_ID=MMETSP1442-20131203/35882_1 /TAXON_ID= /ORGANISM="Craspedostauros australis, Strain CCMP3328" /LENGTH=203 /DNA_ID=CAMNT_0043781905 /DNA_START=291 /DNA_END=903 /DNA_ORIENTATION=+
MFWRVLSVPLFGRSEESPLSLGNSSGMFDSSGTAVRYSMVGCWWRRWEEWLGAMSGTMVRKLVAVAWHRLALSQFGFSLGRVGATLPSLTLLFFVWWVETGCSSLPQESGCREDAFDEAFGGEAGGMVDPWSMGWCPKRCFLGSLLDLLQILFGAGDGATRSVAVSAVLSLARNVDGSGAVVASPALLATLIPRNNSYSHQTR